MATHLPSIHDQNFSLPIDCGMEGFSLLKDLTMEMLSWKCPTKASKERLSKPNVSTYT